MNGNRTVTYTENDREIVRQGIEAIKKVLLGDDADRKRSMLFCLDWFMDPYYGQDISHMREELDGLLQNIIISKNNETDVKEDAIGLLMDYETGPYPILEEHFDEIEDSLKPDVRYIMRSHWIEYAYRCSSNRVYPLSIAEGIQNGDMIADNEENMQCVLFWHYCGFAYLSGNVTEEFLEKIYEEYFCKETKRRFVLITDDEKVIRYFEGKPGLLMDQRKEYSFDRANKISGRDLKTDLRIERIDASNRKAIQGRIVPSFSWDSDEAFLKGGFGYIAMDGEKFAAIAFSAAVSSEEVDIGVETAEDYRNRGLAKILAGYMIREIVKNGKTPVWAHAAGNIGSMKTALGVGFKEIHCNTLIRRS